jgi:ADP-heptose:LPS heptosyltransferase/predicted SAM-dependent methyltransferase
MVWKIDGPLGNESGKIKWEITKWTRGRGLDLGCGLQKTYPHFIGVDNGKDRQLFGQAVNADVWVESAADLPMFASGSMDFVFSSHLLEHIPLERTDPRTFPDPIQRALAEKMIIEKHTALEALKEWLRVLKNDGYLVLYVPDEDDYPKVGEPGANPDHCWNVSYDKVVELMKKTGHGWDLVDFQKRNEGIEYSLFFVFQKRRSACHFSWQKDKPKKTACVVRYGAFGDLLQTSSVCAGLKAQGFHVTLMTSPPAHTVIEFDPNIDAFYLQDKDQVPNHMLGDYWAYHRRKYDKWVQLSESVEGSLLCIPGKTPHLWSPAARHRYMNHNYVEFSHLIADIPHRPQVKFHTRESERAWAKAERARLGGAPLVLWALAGSSVHKTWDGLDRTVASILTEFPGSHVVFVGGADAAILEQGWENERRVHCKSGKYGIRETMSLLEVVDVGIGPETGVMNAMSQLPQPKVLFLSHSTEENLCRDWVNTTSIASENTHCPGRGANEAPACHMLHYSWEFCRQHPERGIAQCQADIDGEAAWHAIRDAIYTTINTERANPHLA